LRWVAQVRVAAGYHEPLYGSKEEIMENCTVSDLKGMIFDKSIRPLMFIDCATEIRVTNWTDLCLEFVNWLIRKGYLEKDKLPIPNHANRGKYLINSEPRHKYPEKDGL